MNVAAQKKRPPLHPLEGALVGLVGVQLGFMSWAFGAMHVWSQLTALGLAAASFVVALWPRRYDGALTEGLDFTLRPWPRLRRFPLFWLGLALGAYLGVQALNPTWVWARDAKQWWLTSRPGVAWLPTGVATPFEFFNVGRQAIIYATAWLGVCALWVGITRRRSLQLLLWGLVGNGVALALVGFAQRMLGEPRVLGVRTFPGAGSFASFVYQNHAGAYFSLLTAVALGLAAWTLHEGRRRLARSSPAPVGLFCAALLVFAVLFSFSRGAVITLVLFLVGAAVAAGVVRGAGRARSTTHRGVVVGLGLLFAGTLAFMVQVVDFSVLARRFEELARQGANTPSVVARAQARAVATDMWMELGLRGTGAGSFRFLYPKYIAAYPGLYRGGTMFWDHAHIDWLEIPIELGATGVLLLATAFGWCLARWWRGRGWRHPLAALLALGSAQTLQHAAFDFPFQNPAILTLWWMLWIIALRWLELERAAEPGAPRAIAGSPPAGAAAKLAG